MPPADVPTGAANALGNLWESVGLLVRGGHLDRRVAYTSMSFTVQRDWATLAPFAAKMREDTGMSAIYEHFEWLAGEMAGMDRARGGVVVFDDTYLAGLRPVDARVVPRPDPHLRALEGCLRAQRAGYGATRGPEAG